MGPRRWRGGAGVLAGVAVPLPLSSEKRLDCGVVSPLLGWESKVVERSQGSAKKASKSQERDCATAPRGEPSGVGSLALCQSRGRGTWV